MSIYTIVGEDYCVSIRRSLKSVFDFVNGKDFFLDSENEIPLTKKSLSLELKKNGEARIYELGANDWREKIERQD